MSVLINKLKKYINNIRDIRKYTINSDDLTEEQLYFLHEGFREGLCSAAMMLADELDAEIGYEKYLDLEENWWHTHTDENGDIGTNERLIIN